MSNNIYFKVVTADMKSLGLRNNPTILKYTKSRWIKSPTIKHGKSDDGGIWVCRHWSGAKKLVKYMKEKHGVNTKIYSCIIKNVLYENSYRIKTDMVQLWAEMNPDIYSVHGKKREG